MSLNALYDRSHVLTIQELQTALESNISAWSSAQTKEERGLIEIDVYRRLEELMNLRLKTYKVTEFLNPDYVELDLQYRKIMLAMKAMNSKFKAFIDKYLNYENSRQIALNSLYSRLKRIRQKDAVLRFRRGESIGYRVVENFYTVDDIIQSEPGEAVWKVFPQQGIATLPIEAINIVQTKQGVILRSSNGQLGNVAEDINIDNINLNNVLNSNPSLWFEYERLDNGPLRLAVKFEFSSPQIINALKIEPLISDDLTPFVIKELSYERSNGENLGIKELVGREEDLEVSNSKLDNIFNLVHLPVKAISCTIVFEQNTPARINLEGRSGKLYQRLRYAIGLKNIFFQQILFKKKGILRLEEKAIPQGLYAAKPFVEAWPARRDLFHLEASLSHDNSTTWTPVKSIYKEQDIVLDGFAESVASRYFLKVDSDALAETTSFLFNRTGEVKSLTKGFSSSQGKLLISLAEKISEEPWIYCPRIARRGDKSAQLQVGTTSLREQSVTLPIDLATSKIDLNEVRVYKNNKELLRIDNNLNLDVSQWAISSDFSEIELGGTADPGERVSLVFDQEQLLLEKYEDGYYHEMHLPFDPEKKNITINYYPGRTERFMETLDRTRRILRLENSDIIPGTLELEGSSGTYIEVSNRTELQDTPGGYLVDYRKGILWTREPFGTDDVVVTYEARPLKSVPQSGFEVIFDGARPWGIKILPEYLEADQYIKEVGTSPQPVLNITSGRMTVKSDIFSSNSFVTQLDHNNIIKNTVVLSPGFFTTTPKEVPFIDGKTEFKGLLKMIDERTNEIEPTSGIVQFLLSVGSRVDTDSIFLFSDTSIFSNRVNDVSNVTSVGDWHVSSIGMITVYTGSSNLPANIRMQYMYSNPEFKPEGKYSIDYKQGIFYSYEPQTPGSTIKYKSADYQVAYDIVKPVDSFVFNRGKNQIEVDVENLARFNLLKVLWKESLGDSLSELRDYFSPLIYNVGVAYQ